MNEGGYGIVPLESQEKRRTRKDCDCHYCIGFQGQVSPCASTFV
jgi:hypothetical protein